MESSCCRLLPDAEPLSSSGSNPGCQHITLHAAHRGVYTQRFNRRHECDGTLFRGRYKSILIEADSYLLTLVRYIHRNPIKAGLSDRLGG